MYIRVNGQSRHPIARRTQNTKEVASARSKLILGPTLSRLQDGVSILGGAIGAMRIPEKWFPGVVDFYLNSHNIMHVLVVVAVYSMHKVGIPKG